VINQIEILNQFDSISLAEMDSVKLMDRTDTKYVFTESLLPEFINALTPHYRILSVNGNRISKYESLYFDTPNFELFQKHHQGKLNRFKIRFRKYVESDLNFFEVKFKNNKGRTIKDRVKQKYIGDTINDKAELLLNEKTPILKNNLEPKIWVNYSRITLVNKHSPERVTLDLGLHFKNQEQIKHIENIVIAEVKQDKSLASPFIRLMRQYHIREGSISKYCFGIISIFDKIKHNNFKPKLLQLKKIANVTITSNG
jgi:hypothetical protein